jgi:hypothetical protein
MLALEKKNSNPFAFVLKWRHAVVLVFAFQKGESVSYSPKHNLVSIAYF